IYLGSRDVSVADSAAQSMRLAALGEDLIPVLIAADQEGGRIQRMAGPGFSTIPSAREQGTMDDEALRTSWAKWGRELVTAGVRFNLAPVADTVPESQLRSNAPIGALQRNFGTDPDDVSDAVVAVVEGLADAKVATSLKHFPGLGRVTTNTDFGVAVDDVTTTRDDLLEPFTEAMEAGVSSVMVSSAIYSRIDPGVPAVHSSTIVTGLLREQLGWQGVVISDDLGAAGALDSVAARDRGVRFIAAGGDLVINADPGTIDEMIEETLARAASDRAFADGLDAHVSRVLQLKASVGLVECA
ncbi:MAG TPA: glycoside hydrolase family 3 N-terminal domain-containing protein, partial [Propionibacteriaceae bacterium]|nr:glycoside hydrolase family 3 N-terminal domain-containing protein [Propionibacteriaceae bacterium]